MDELMQLLGGNKGKAQQESDPLGHLLAALLGGAEGKEGSSPAGLLSSLLAGGAAPAGDPVAGLAEQAQVTPAVVQAVLALLAGRLAGEAGQGEAARKAAGIDLSALLAQASSGEEPDPNALKASGLPQELMKTTGLDLSAAIKALQKLLPLLGGLFNLPGLKPTAGAKPRPTTQSAAKPKPTDATTRPKPASSTAKPKPKPASSTAKPRPTTQTAAKPKPASSAAKPKPTTGAAKPKPASSAAKPEPTTRPRPRKSEGLPEIEINLNEPTDPDA
jgi:hypothetical protein